MVDVCEWKAQHPICTLMCVYEYEYEYECEYVCGLKMHNCPFEWKLFTHWTLIYLMGMQKATTLPMSATSRWLFLCVYECASQGRGGERGSTKNISKLRPKYQNLLLGLFLKEYLFKRSSQLSISEHKNHMIWILFYLTPLDNVLPTPMNCTRERFCVGLLISFLLGYVLYEITQVQPTVFTAGFLLLCFFFMLHIGSPQFFILFFFLK